MHHYLEPVRDGLAMRDSGVWAAEKLDYLERYIEIFETSMRKKWARRNFIDLFSGPGKCITDTGKIFLGSPLLAVSTAHPFTGYFFADYEPMYINDLQTRCSESAVSDRIRFYPDDSNRAVHQIVDEIEKSDREFRSSSLNLAFLDPEGLELEWSTVAALASVPKMDLLIHYPVMGLNRMLERAAHMDVHKIDHFFGGQEWRKIYEKVGDVSVVERELLAHYKNKLQTFGYKVDQDSETGQDPPIRNTKGGLLYRLLFASKDPLGHKFWKEVIKRDIHGQRRMPGFD